MRPKLIILMIMFMLHVQLSPAHAENRDTYLKGHVLDAQTGQHIAYATIGIRGTTIGAATDASGHFLLRNLPEGEYTVTASFMGYETSEVKVRLDRNKAAEIRFELNPRSLALDVVVVTGSRNETNKKESSTIVNVIPARLFETTASVSPAEVLNYQSGLRVEQTCSNCGVPQLRINGLEGQYSQILLDSRPIFSSLATVYGLEQLPAGMIERIEVIRGGGSALFGSNAIGGVVNIITKEPVRNLLTLSNTTAVTENGAKDIVTNFNGAFVTDDHKMGAYIFGMARNRDTYDRNGDGFSDIPKLRSESLGFRGYYNLSAYSKITAEYHRIGEFRRGGDNLDRPPHEVEIAEQLRHEINGGSLKFDRLSPNYKNRLSVFTSLQNIDRDSYFGTGQNPDAYGKTTDLTFIGGSQYAMSFDRLIFMPSQLTVGAEYTFNHLTDRMLGYHRIIDQRSICYGTYVQNEWKNERLGILIGGRFDKHNKVEEPIFSPRANIRYTPSDAVGFRASYSSGYRAPQAYDEDLHVAAVGGEVAIITLAPDLRPEYSQSVSASADIYKRFGTVETNLLIEGFHTDIKDVFTLEPNGMSDDGNFLWERRNGSGATVSGVNLELKVGFTPKVIMDAGFTIQRSRYKESLAWSENPELSPERNMLRTPDQYGYLTLNCQATKSFTVSLSGVYTGTMLVPHYGGDTHLDDWMKRTPDFFDLGIRLAYDFRIAQQTTLQLSSGVRNILDSYQSDVDRGMNKDAGYIYGPAMPRMFVVGVRLSM